MANVERICPRCGTTNPYDRERCHNCGTSLTRQLATRSPGQIARSPEARALAVAAGAAAVLARAGFKLLINQILPRAADKLRAKPPVTIDQSGNPAEPEPDYVIRGWRTWSARRGSDESSGSENFEWKIRSNRERK